MLFLSQRKLLLFLLIQVVNYGIGGHYIPHHDYFKVGVTLKETVY